MSAFAARLISAYGSAKDPFRRLYVSRRFVENRRMINEKQIEAIARAAGFEIVRPEQLSIADQVNLFSQATTICGPMGAGLTNMMFAPSRAHVITLSPGMHDFFFYDLASLRAQTFTWIFTEHIKPFHVSDLHGNYSISADLIRGALSLLSA